MTPAPEMPPARTGLTKRSWFIPTLVVAIVAIGGLAAWYFWPRPSVEAKVEAGKGKGAGGPGGARRGGFDPNRVQPVTAVAGKVTNINIVQTALGTVTSGRTALVKPRVDGLLQSVSFNEGQVVAAGAPLAQIDPVPFQVALAQAQGMLARDAAQLSNARLDLDRYKKLLEQDSIAAQQLDQQAALVKQLEGTVKVDEAQVDNAKLQLSWTKITAPIAGKTGLRLVDPGNMIRASDASGIVVITQVDPVAVVFTIPQDALPRVLARLKAGEKPAVEAWDREQKTLLAKGTLITTDNQIDVATGTVRLKAEFPNKEGKLFPNQFVNVRMVVDVRKDVVAVPSAAIQRNAQGATVAYVVKDDSTIGVRPVTVGATEGLLTAVEKGLQAGERVVTDGVDRIREGAKVEVIDASQPAAERARNASGGSREDFRKRLEAMTPEQREAFKKKMESMTPEQREELRRRRQAGDAGKDNAPK
jgi:multidrug efflux system membrane fusion protein